MEKWSSIEGFPGYEISTLGRVKSFRRHDAGRVLKTWKSPRGYINVTLFLNGKRKPSLLHRLIGKAFVPNPDNKPEINHLNGIKDDNRTENLEWVTASENVQHGFDTGLTSKAFGEKNGNAKLTESEVRQIKQLKGQTQQNIADMFGTSQGNIGRILRGEQWADVV